MSTPAEPDWYDQLCHHFDAMLESLGADFTAAHREEIQRYWRVGEFGPALEALTWIVIKEGLRLPRTAYRHMRAIAADLEMEEEPRITAVDPSVSDD